MIATWLINLIVALFFWQTNLPVMVSDNVEIISPRPNVQKVEIGAEKSAVLLSQDRSFLFCKQADEVQPIASITKLMTALVFLENNPGWEEIYQITRNDQIAGGRLNLFLGERVKVRDLFNTSLIASDNGATIALVHASGLTEAEFVDKMNDRTKTLGLSKTNFVDPIGLSDHNVSTAREVALLAKAALGRNEIKAATEKQEYQFNTLDGRSKNIESTDYLLFDSEKNSFQVLGGKTGYTDQAGYCFVGLFRDPEGREIISVVLNSAGKNERFRESKSLVNWVFNSYIWKR